MQRPCLTRIQAQFEITFDDIKGIQTHNTVPFQRGIGFDGDDGGGEPFWRQRATGRGAVDPVVVELSDVGFGGEIGGEGVAGVDVLQDDHPVVYNVPGGWDAIGEDGFAFGVVGGDVVGHGSKCRRCCECAS